MKRILNKMVDRRGRGGTDTVRYLVRWEGHGPRDDKWIAAKDLPSGSGDLVKSFEARDTVSTRLPARLPRSRRQAKKVSFADPVVEDLDDNTQDVPEPESKRTPSTEPTVDEPVDLQPTPTEANSKDTKAGKPLSRTQRFARAVKRKLGCTT